jgi:predicted TIM-barrel fold metal-dependent hydrolase
MTMTMTEDTSTIEGVMDGIQIVDCDAHFTEPPDLWTSRVAQSQLNAVPVQKTEDGVTAWYLNDELWCGIGGNTVATGPKKVLGEHIIQPFSDIDPAAWDVKPRLQLMDTQGVYAAVLYPNGVGFASNHIHAIEDHTQRNNVLHTYNDFYIDIQEESDGRLLPQAMLPVWDMDLTVAEMERLLAKGARGFTLSDKPEMVGLPSLNEPYWHPMWDLANSTGAVMNFHIGSGSSRAIKADTEDLAKAKLARPAESGLSELYWPSFGPQRRLAILATQMYMSNARVIVNFCMSDMFDRYPNLKISSAESGIGWIPFILEAMEYQIEEMVTYPEEVNLQKRRPTDYFRDHFYVTYWFEKIGPQKLIDDVGVNNILVETDVPHPTCVYPGTRDRLAGALVGLDKHVIRRILQDNGAELYKVDLPAA